MLGIPRLHKETSIFKEDAIANGIDDASKTAEYYITDISPANGIWITPSTAKPNSSGQATSSTSGWHISDALELFRLGASMFKVWLESSATKVRIGNTANSHIVLDSGIHLKNGDNGDPTNYPPYDMVTLDSTNGLILYADELQDAYTKVGAGQVTLEGGQGDYGQISFGEDYDFDISAGIGYFNIESRENGGNENILSYDAETGIEVGDNTTYARVHNAKTLFSGTYASTHSSPIELDVGGYDPFLLKRLLVEYEDSTGRKGSVWVEGLTDGTTFGTQTTTANSSTGMVIRTKTYVLAYDTNAAKWKMNTATYSANVYQYGKVTIGTNGAATWSSAEEIGITKVIGYY